MRGWWVEGGRVAVVFNFFCTRAVFLVYFLAPWQFFWHHGSFFQFIFCHHGSYFSFFWHHGSLFSFFLAPWQFVQFFLPPWQFVQFFCHHGSILVSFLAGSSFYQLSNIQHSAASLKRALYTFLLKRTEKKCNGT